MYYGANNIFGKKLFNIIYVLAHNCNANYSHMSQIEFCPLGICLLDAFLRQANDASCAMSSVFTLRNANISINIIIIRGSPLWGGVVGGVVILVTALHLKYDYEASD